MISVLKTDENHVISQRRLYCSQENENKQHLLVYI